jgi:GMP synthase-like glutamine amidotransferase
VPAAGSRAFFLFSGENMQIHILQHVPYEDAGIILDWAAEKGHHPAVNRLFAGDSLPPLQDIGWLVAMGGPMSVHDGAKFGWLSAEKQLIREAINAGIPVIGVCLGAQLAAEALGATVRKAPHREIGWFDIEKTEAAARHPWTRELPQTMPAFHWHGETFSLPDGAVPLFRSRVCETQGFVWENRVLALQCHLEISRQHIEEMIQHCAGESGAEPYVHDATRIRNDAFRFLPETGKHMRQLLNAMAADTG